MGLPRAAPAPAVLLMEGGRGGGGGLEGRWRGMSLVGGAASEFVLSEHENNKGCKEPRGPGRERTRRHLSSPFRSLDVRALGPNTDAQTSRSKIQLNVC